MTFEHKGKFIRLKRDKPAPPSNYEKKVREIAEEMARSEYGDYDSMELPFRRALFNQNLSKARIAVKHMANAVIDYAYDDREFYESDHEGKKSFIKELARLGLIPSPENKEQ